MNMILCLTVGWKKKRELRASQGIRQKKEKRTLGTRKTCRIVCRSKQKGIGKACKGMDKED